MRAAVAVGFVVAWDDDGPPCPRLPVRCLDDELTPPVIIPATMVQPHKPRGDASASRVRSLAYRRRLQDEAEDLRRRPGPTKGTRHE